MALVLGWVGWRVLPFADVVLREHLHWVVPGVIGFLMFSEKPEGRGIGMRGRARWVDVWARPVWGWMVLVLSGWLGLILTGGGWYEPWRMAQDLAPALAGIFTMPWLLLSLSGRREVPQESRLAPICDGDGGMGSVWRGGGAGFAGGLLAALVPGMSSAVGGMVGWSIVAPVGDRAMLVGQGAAKAACRVGGVLLLFVPGVLLARGGMPDAPWIDGRPEPGDAMLMCGCACLAAAVAVWATGLLGRLAERVVTGSGLRCVTWLAMASVAGWVLLFAGGRGFGVMLAGTGIGLLSLLLGVRPVYGLGVVLVPLAVALSG
jgi:TctA family transporter